MTVPVDAPPHPPAKILLVDKPDDLPSLEAILADLGQDLIRASSGEEAQRLVQGDDFAVVLLGLDLPGLDAFETARRVRGREQSRHTPLIFLAAQEGGPFPLVEAYKLGAVDYLVRPLIPEILRAKVEVF